jgi:MYXO-CTERM domain-containing protein
VPSHPDASTPNATDGAVLGDAGSSKGGSGCGCGAAGQGPALLALLGAVLALRRRGSR